MPNLKPLNNQQNSNRNEEKELTTSNKFENYLLSIRDERQRMVYPNCHPTYNERHEKIIEMINWTLEKYKANKKNTQQNKQEVIIDDIIKELAKKRDIAIHEKKQAQPKDEVSSMYRLQETTLDYVLFRICKLTGRLI